MNRKEIIKAMLPIIREHQNDALVMGCQLYKAGFGNVKDVLMEFANKLKEKVRLSIFGGTFGEAIITTVEDQIDHTLKEFLK